MKRTLVTLYIIVLGIGSLFPYNGLVPALNNVPPHPATNCWLAMGLKGRVQEFRTETDEGPADTKTFWFSSTGLITREESQDPEGSTETTYK